MPKISDISELLRPDGTTADWLGSKSVNEDRHGAKEQIRTDQFLFDRPAKRKDPFEQPGVDFVNHALPSMSTNADDAGNGRENAIVSNSGDTVQGEARPPVQTSPLHRRRSNQDRNDFVTLSKEDFSQSLDDLGKDNSSQSTVDIVDVEKEGSSQTRADSQEASLQSTMDVPKEASLQSTAGVSKEATPESPAAHSLKLLFDTFENQLGDIWGTFADSTCEVDKDDSSESIPEVDKDDSSQTKVDTGKEDSLQSTMQESTECSLQSADIGKEDSDKEDSLQSTADVGMEDFFRSTVDASKEASPQLLGGGSLQSAAEAGKEDSWHSTDDIGKEHSSQTTADVGKSAQGEGEVHRAWRSDLSIEPLEKVIDLTIAPPKKPVVRHQQTNNSSVEEEDLRRHTVSKEQECVSKRMDRFQAMLQAQRRFVSDRLPQEEEAELVADTQLKDGHGDGQEEEAELVADTQLKAEVTGLHAEVAALPAKLMSSEDSATQEDDTLTPCPVESEPHEQPVAPVEEESEPHEQPVAPVEEAADPRPTTPQEAWQHSMRLLQPQFKADREARDAEGAAAIEHIVTVPRLSKALERKEQPLLRSLLASDHPGLQAGIHEPQSAKQEVPATLVFADRACLKKASQRSASVGFQARPQSKMEYSSDLSAQIEEPAEGSNTLPGLYNLFRRAQTSWSKRNIQAACDKLSMVGIETSDQLEEALADGGQRVNSRLKALRAKVFTQETWYRLKTAIRDVRVEQSWREKLAARRQQDHSRAEAVRVPRADSAPASPRASIRRS